MFDIGGPEFLLLIVIALLVFGPRRLPQIGRQLGGFAAQMRAAMRDFRGNLEREVALEDVRRAADEVKGLGREAGSLTRELAGVGAPPPADPTRRLRESQRDSAPAAPAPVTGDERPPT